MAFWSENNSSGPRPLASDHPARPAEPELFERSREPSRTDGERD
ncbi:MAG TPA: hypothetical protein VGO91_11475 [Pyrinomonadaceae bacterium]|nr:hypothetical protein [Pyrinomonadaceae bacterium]